MSKFVFGYHGGGGAEATEDMDAVMAAWDRWYGEIGTALVDGGAPFGQLRTVAHDGAVAEGGGANPLTGYTIVGMALIIPSMVLTLTALSYDPADEPTQLQAAAVRRDRAVARSGAWL